MTKLIQVVDFLSLEVGKSFKMPGEGKGEGRGGAISRWVDELYILTLSLASLASGFNSNWPMWRADVWSGE